MRVEGHSDQISVVLFTYNRDQYLAKCLGSLLSQDDLESFELILFDNGSTIPVAETHRALLESFSGPVKLLREETNFLSPQRWIQAFENCTHDWVLLPGDDDLPLSNYISTFRSLVRANKSATMLSAAYRNIDSEGRPSPGGGVPPCFDSPVDALAMLLTTNQYGMPTSGFRLSAADFSTAPMTRSSFDWWLWIQAWLHGTAAVSSEVVLKYRVHAGQEQHHYGRQGFTLDGARMIAGVITSEPFRSLLETWSPPDRRRFVESILDGPGLNNGDSRWGPLLQIQLADVLRDLIEPVSTAELVGQASAQAGVISSVGALRTAASDPAIERLPSRTWSRVPVSAAWTCGCQECSNWKHYLNLPEEGPTRLSLRIHCSQSAGASALAILTDTETGATTAIPLDYPVGDTALTPLLEAIGQATGRPHGFETTTGVEARAVEVIRKLRSKRPMHWLENRVRLLRQRTRSRR